MATNALYLSIRVEDREANRAIDAVNRNLDSVGDHGKKGADAASRAIDQLRERLQAAAKVPPPPIPVEKLRQLQEETQRLKGQTGVFGELASGVGRVSGAFSGLLTTALGAYGGIMSLRGALKELLDSANFAARTEQLGYALGAVGAAAGLTRRTVDATTAAIQRHGFTLQSARENMTRLIAANIDYRKAADLARVSQDLGRVANVSSGEAFQRLTHAIVTLQPEMLRTLGLSVNLERGYRQYAKAAKRTADDLTEVEKRQIATNLTLKAATAYAGVYVESQRSVGGQLLSMKRYYEELQQEIGVRLLPVYTDLVGAFADSLKWMTENVDILDKAYTLWKMSPEPLSAMRRAFVDVKQAYQDWMGFLEESNKKYQPSEQEKQLGAIYKKAATQGEMGVGGFLSAIQGMHREAEGVKADLNRTLSKDLRQNIAVDTKAATDWLVWYEQRKPMQGSYFGQGMSTPDLLRHGMEQVEKAEQEREKEEEAAAKKRKDAQEKYARELEQAVTRSRELVERAQLSELTGMEKIARERQIALRDIGLTGEAIRNVNKAFDIEVALEQKRMRELGGKFLVESFRDAQKAAKDLKKTRDEAFMQDMKLEQERWKYRLQTADESLSYEDALLRQSKDLELAKLDAVARNDVAGKLATEEAKLEIERRYAQKSLDLQLATANSKAHIEAVNNPQFSTEIMERLEQRKQQIAGASQNEITLLEARSAKTRQQIQVDAWQDAWSRSKRAAEDVFDSLTARGKGFGEWFKTLWLTLLREVVTSHVARVFMGMMGGGAAGGYGGAPQGGMMRGGLGGLLGIGGMGGFGGFPGMPGGTGGFSGPVGGAGGGMGGMAGGLGWSGMLANYKGLLGKLGGMPTTVFDEMGQATTYGKGVYGAKGGGLLLGGGVLAAMGLKRGGWSGLGMTTAGGALMGAKFGPIGAAIGGAVGFGAGLIRMMFKGATEKAKEKIKTLYGLDVRDKTFLQQIVDIAKQTYAGNLDMAIRSTQIRDLLELYAMSTGQSFGLSGSVARPFVATQSGGGNIWQQVQYDSGRAYTQQSSLATMGGGGATVQVFIGDQSAAQAWQGEVVQATIVNNARTVQEATATASRGNHMRRSNWAQGAAPTQLLA